MRQVHVIETFEDLVHAFSGVRSPDDKYPMAGSYDKIHILEGGKLRLESKTFMLSDDMRDKGKQLIVYCITKTLGSVGRYTCDTLGRFLTCTDTECEE